MRVESDSPDRVRVLIATAHEGVPVIVSELARGNRTQTVGLISCLTDAQTSVNSWQPDVVVVDVATMACIDALPAVTSVAPTVVVSSIAADVALLPCVAAGARGFVCKPLEPGVIDDAVAAVAEGHPFVDRHSMSWFLDAAVRHRQAGCADFGSGGERSLSPRQDEILKLVYQGLTNDEIAVALRISTNTVKTHLGRAMRTLGVHDRREAAEEAHNARAARTGRPLL